MKRLVQNILQGATLFLALLSSGQGLASDRDDFVSFGATKLHYGIYDTDSPALGDILYFHGYGDKFQNHESLFQAYNQAGLRVIAFDFPSHGQTTGGKWDEIDFQSFESLANMARLVLSVARPESDTKPLFLAGWSMGGLFATRIVQDKELRKLFPAIKGLILYAPGVALQPCTGNFACGITNETLTHDLSFLGREIKPDNALLHLGFMPRLMISSLQSWKAALPEEFTTLVFVAGDEDRYVKTPMLVKWVGSLRANYISSIAAFQCVGAHHELDNETSQFGGEFVRRVSADYLSKLVRGESWDKNQATEGQEPCRAF